MIFHRRLLLAWLGTLWVARPASAAPTRPKVALLPLGSNFPRADVELVTTAVRELLGLEVQVLDLVALPQRAYYQPRRRYRAEKLLRFLEERQPPNAFRILGLTQRDISTTKGKHYDWGILGLATLDGGQCVVSKYRCRRKARNAGHARIRLAKVVVHELGHTLGLPHCPTRGCLMEDGGGSVLTTDREYDLCPQCRKKLRASGYRVPARPAVPWPRPNG